MYIEKLCFRHAHDSMFINTQTQTHARALVRSLTWSAAYAPCERVFALNNYYYRRRDANEVENLTTAREQKKKIKKNASWYSARVYLIYASHLIRIIFIVRIAYKCIIYLYKYTRTSRIYIII